MVLPKWYEGGETMQKAQGGSQAAKGVLWATQEGGKSGRWARNQLNRFPSM